MTLGMMTPSSRARIGTTTRSKDGELGPFKMGGFRVAAAGDCDVVPIAIGGTLPMMPPGREFELGYGEPTVTVLPPISPADAGHDATRLRDMAREAIAAELSKTK